MKKIIPAEDLALPDILTAIETECWRTSSMLYCSKKSLTRPRLWLPWVSNTTATFDEAYAGFPKDNSLHWIVTILVENLERCKSYRSAILWPSISGDRLWSVLEAQTSQLCKYTGQSIDSKNKPQSHCAISFFHKLQPFFFPPTVVMRSFMPTAKAFEAVARCFRWCTSLRAPSLTLSKLSSNAW